MNTGFDLPWHERAELTRQGAKAAARGDCISVNPLQQRPNGPGETGESLRRWAERSAAWLLGHRSQLAAGRKRSRWNDEDRA